ncbi:hypothetical protein BTR22_19100 [Alkalihalophilus pseudofirmus]|uniref:hypothetical protein n=1 Tax=Alkalihalophilus pseudofirmus TaxID=79885 RepID=UPI0009531C07|nr:hypothetical protein BTR22_19100 [Alkalihalophilus pseudofirmus]
MIIHTSYGVWRKPQPYPTEELKIQHEQDLDQRHRLLCEKFGLDYEAIKGKENEPIIKCV